MIYLPHLSSLSLRYYTLSVLNTLFDRILPTISPSTKQILIQPKFYDEDFHIFRTITTLRIPVA
ncbi:hypothetical protein BDD12DRAFT_829815 [Trichophaea hybrida]|nr:hypothetical protein BDD12DRAFT_829815 [Trichophaea hybrida]